MSEVQIPSTRLNQFLNNPKGGETISESQEFIQPTIEVRDFLYPITVGIHNFAAGGDVFVIPTTAGAGIYEMRGRLAGFIRNGVNAGRFDIVVLLIAAGGAGSTIPATLLNYFLAASTDYNIAAIDFVIRFEVNKAQSENAVGVQFLNNNFNAAMTAISLQASYTVQRVV